MCEWSGVAKWEGWENSEWIVLISCLNHSNEGIIGGEAETRDFMVKCGERPLEGEGL